MCAKIQSYPTVYVGAVVQPPVYANEVYITHNNYTNYFTGSYNTTMSKFSYANSYIIKGGSRNNVYYSTNQTNSSTGYKEFTANQDMLINMMYYVSSEGSAANPWDNLKIYKTNNTSSILNKVITGTDNDIESLGWHLLKKGETLRVQYYKDSTQSRGDDRGYVYDIRVRILESNEPMLKPVRASLMYIGTDSGVKLVTAPHFGAPD